MNTPDPDGGSSGSKAFQRHIDVPEPQREILGIRRPRALRPPPSARCAGCGSDMLSSVRTFSAGSGVGARPFAEDVICHGCSFIGPPTLLAK